MDLYKSIAFLIILNIAISFVNVVASPEKNFTDWLGNGEDDTRAINTAQSSKNTLGNEGEIQSQNNPLKIDDGQGFSLMQMGSILWNLINNVLFGGIQAGLSVATTYDLRTNTIVSVVGYLLVIFFSYLTIAITVKTIAWWRNRDIR